MRVKEAGRERRGGERSKEVDGAEKGREGKRGNGEERPGGAGRYKRHNLIIAESGPKLPGKV